MIALADLWSIKKRFGVEFRADTSFYDHLGTKTWGAALVVEGVPVRDAGPVLDALSELGAEWPSGRVMLVYENDPIGIVRGRIPVAGCGGWDLFVDVHHGWETRLDEPTRRVIRRVEV